MTIPDMRSREYLTPLQASRVFGRSPGFWRGLMDSGVITAYLTDSGRKWLHADSCREYLRGLHTAVDASAVAHARLRDALREMRQS